MSSYAPLPQDGDEGAKPILQTYLGMPRDRRTTAAARFDDGGQVLWACVTVLLVTNILVLVIAVVAFRTVLPDVACRLETFGHPTYYRPTTHPYTITAPADTSSQRSTMCSTFFTSLLVVFVAYASIASTSAAPVDRRGNYTGRLFAHHAHERVGPTAVATSAQLEAFHTVAGIMTAAATSAIEVVPTAVA
ncbi:hypothetical protein C8Q79DRAFT_1013414 [Trametes meyenii]|nr:hypothetical protein C8Q79DRAFT_1013414 [Trametes meyenii]